MPAGVDTSSNLGWVPSVHACVDLRPLKWWAIIIQYYLMFDLFKLLLMRMSSCLSVYNYIYWMFDFWCSCFGLRKSSETKLFMLERAGGPHDFSWLWPTSVKLSLSGLKLQIVMPCNCHFFFQAFISSLSVKVLGVWAWVCMQGQGDDPYRFLLILICYCYSVNIDKFGIFFQTVVSWCSRWPSLQGQQILLVDWVPSPVFMKCTFIIYLPILTCYIFRSI